ncbi:MAG: metal ABC transporter permease [Muribaculaceae bacterium]|nr:metal ABC transporter permease [Muribaculaceae bacterium]
MHELLGYSFFTNALIGVVLIAVASAMIGTYVVTRRLVAITGGVTHACFGGLGLGYYLGWNPLAVAAAVAVGAALGVEWLSARRMVREDSAIAVIWSAGMAAGVMFVFLTPGYVPELNAFLFGNILNISSADLWMFAAFTALLAGVFCWKFRQIVTCAFDRDFAHVAGMPVALVNGVMTVLTALCVVLTIRLVGIMLLMAMFTLPQMTAELFCHRFKTIMAASALISVAGSAGGVLLSAYIDVPCSALIVMTSGALYAAARIALAAGKRNLPRRKEARP